MDLTLPFPGAFQAARDDGESDALRPLNWSALLARLGAERDLRRELANGLCAVRTGADFVGGAAQVLGGPSHNASHDAPGVNPDALANLKSTGGITVVAEANGPSANLGARGQQ